MSLAMRVKRWFTGTPDEYNPTNDDIGKHHKRQVCRETFTSSGAAPFSTPEDKDIPTTGAAQFATPVNVGDTTISRSLLYLENGPIQP